MAEDDWVRERLAQGEPPEDIVRDLVSADWPEDTAQKVVWKAIGTEVKRGGRERFLAVLSVAMSALALVVAVAAVFIAVTGPAPSASTPVEGRGGAETVDGTDGAPSGEETLTVTIEGGVLSGPVPGTATAPARLEVANRDSQAYTVTSSGLGISEELQPGERVTFRITSSGTYTVTLEGQDSSVTFSLS